MGRQFYFSVCLGVAVFFASLPAVNAAQKSQALKLFGVPLKGASRAQLGQAIKKSGMRVVREDKRYWVDEYNAAGVLKGASEFIAGYVAATDKFAYAQYKFEAFMDTQLVGKVIDMVSSKYGHPSSQRGHYNLGRVTAIWNTGNGMQIEVTRGWPDTTTYLIYKDLSAYRQMQAEIQSVKKQRQRQQAKSQSNAF